MSDKQIPKMQGLASYLRAEAVRTVVFDGAPAQLTLLQWATEVEQATTAARQSPEVRQPHGYVNWDYELETFSSTELTPRIPTLRQRPVYLGDVLPSTYDLEKITK